MKLLIFIISFGISLNAFAERGPYFESFEKAPISHGTLIFASGELSQINEHIFIGDVLVKKFKGGFEVAPMIYKCDFNEDDGAYGSLSCRFHRYEIKKAITYKDCEVFNNEYFNCL